MKYLKTYEEVGGITFKEWLKKNPQFINTDTIRCYGENLIDLDGIQKFKNLKDLYCYRNNLTGLNLEGLDNLRILYCSNNNLTSLDLEGLDNLQKLYCYNNKLTSLNLEGLNKLEELYCLNNNLTQLNLEGLNNLKVLSCLNNNLPYDDLDEYWEWWEKEYPDRAEAKKFNF